MSSFDDQMMREAIALSAKNLETGEGGPFGAVIVHNKKIVGRGWNKVTSHCDPTAHAEVEAIRAAAQNLKNFDLSSCEIYTSCEPCPMCLAAIYWARISKIYYGNTHQDAADIQFDDAFIYQEVAKKPQDRTIPMQSCLREEAQKVFQDWVAKEDKIPY